MRFWDTSAVVPLIVEEPRTGATLELLQRDDQMAVWWSTVVEAASALNRKLRAGETTDAELQQAMGLLKAVQRAWLEISPSEDVRSQAIRLSRVHPLRSADALQLAAALTWASHYEFGEFVSYDERLRAAARAEGFLITPP